MIQLRAVRQSDLATFFEHQRDAEAADMVGFVPRAREAFDRHWQRILTEPSFVVLTVEVAHETVGYVSAFSRDGRPEIAYWFGREHWHRGIGKDAVSQFLAWHRARPIFGTVAATNPASLAILRRCGFLLVEDHVREDGWKEHLLRLD